MRPQKITWGAETPHERGPIIGSFNKSQDRNVIGTYSGGYGLYRALAIAAGTLDPVHKPDLTNTTPTTKIPRHAIINKDFFILYLSLLCKWCISLLYRSR